MSPLHVVHCMKWGVRVYGWKFKFVLPAPSRVVNKIRTNSNFFDKKNGLMIFWISIFPRKTMVKTKHACVMDVVQITCGCKYFICIIMKTLFQKKKKERKHHDNWSKSYSRSTYKLIFFVTPYLSTKYEYINRVPHVLFSNHLGLARMLMMGSTIWSDIDI
jgi:hypothetical protein